MSKRRWWTYATWIYMVGLFMCLFVRPLWLMVVAYAVFGGAFGYFATGSYERRFKRG